MDEIWSLLARILGEQESSVEWVLCRLAELWQAALGDYDVCVVSARDKEPVGKFLVCAGGDAPAAANVREFHKLASTEWNETVSSKLAVGFEEYQSLKFRGADRTAVGGILIGTDTAIADDDLVEAIKLVSAQALKSAQGVGLDDGAVSPVVVSASPGDSGRKDWQSRALDPDRLESLAEFAAGAGHEINNPLGTIVGRVQLLLRDESDIDRRQSLSTIGGQAYRIRDMIGDVMLFARPPKPEPEWNSLTDVVEEVLNGFEEELATAEFDADIEFPRSARVFADPVQVRVALGALVRNVIEAAGERGDREFRIRAKECQIDDRSGLEITISDNGIGLTDEQRRHLFDPFYSGRQAGRGLGFGLSKCWRIVSNHGGRIDVGEERGWTTFKLTFPDAPD